MSNGKWKPLLPDQRTVFEEFCRENIERFDPQPGEVDTTCECPFCHGGRRNELTFDLNVETGAWRCWRERHCGRRGNAASLIAEVMNVEYEAAKDYLKGDRSDPRFLKAYVKHLDRFIYDHASANASYVNSFMVQVDDVVPLEEYEDAWEVYEWLEIERGYDPEVFLSQNRVVVPDQDRFYGRIAFEFTCEGNLAYQLYAFKHGIEPKTLNPDDSILSKTLYGWDDRGSLPILIVNEGIMDRARIASYGLDAVACFGVNLSDDQIVLLALSDYEEVCIFFDEGAEERASKAAKKLAEYASEKDVSFVCPSRAGADPDDLSEDEVFECLDRRTIVSTRAETAIERIMRWRN